MTCTLKTNLVQLSRLILMRVLSSNSPLPAFSTCTIKLNFNNLSRLIQIELSNSCLHIFYVSCNPTALLSDLQSLGGGYSLERLAVFDHFAYSHHLEVGVHLRRRREASCEPVT